MRFSRHAKNRIRALKTTQFDVERALERSVPLGADNRGNHLFVSEIEGAQVRIVVAVDDPGLIVTIHRWRA